MRIHLTLRILWIVLLLGACSTSITLPKIDRHPDADSWRRGVLTSLPIYDPTSANAFQVDLRAYDLASLDLGGSLDDLLYADFDDRTIWPAADRMPQGYDWQRIMELGKDPGLGVRDLHTQGITGKNIGIAIIDQTLLVDHQEYSEQLRLYEELDDITGAWLEAQMHGPAVASIAVGRTVGVAPEADLYYIATHRGGNGSDYTYLADAIHRIVAINKALPRERKIRVISMSIGWGPEVEGYHELMAAVRRARAAGMLVVSTTIREMYGLDLGGLGRAPLADPNTAASYEPGAFWAQAFANAVWRDTYGAMVLVPMDSRTTASPLGTSEYTFSRVGGLSWAIPYVAGVYALAAQVDPAITPKQFWSLALETGQTIKVNLEGQAVPLGPIIDPVALIDAVQSR